MRYFTIKKSVQHSFKKRFPFLGKEREFFFKNTCTNIYVLKPLTFEYNYWRKIRKIVKKLIKRKIKARLKIRYKFYKKTAWIFLRPNFPISRKSKNSRMGKGVGSFVRWSVRLNRNHKILQFKRILPLRIKYLALWLSFTFHAPFISN